MNPLFTKIFYFKKIIAVIVAVIIYFALTYGTNEQQIAFEKEVIALDINADGIYSDDEVTKEQKQVIEKMQNGSGNQIAPYTLIPFALFCGLFIFFSIVALENYATKKNKTDN
jgi:Na+/H+ antiporter NhaC